MKKVRVFKDFKAKIVDNLQSYKEFSFVHDDSYEYAILMNTPKPKLNIPKENVIGFLWEPSTSRNMQSYMPYAKENVGCYVAGNVTNLPYPFIEHHSFMEFSQYFEKKIFENQPIRKHTMCMIASSCNSLFGHKKRHSLINQLLKTELDIHFYGRNIGTIHQDQRVKGSFNYWGDIYPNYFFDITIENSRDGSYITEKFLRPILCETCPIYWGSSKVREYFTDSFIDLPDSIDESVDLICNIFKNHKEIYSKKIENIHHTKGEMLNYGMFDFANEFFDNGTVRKIKM